MKFKIFIFIISLSTISSCTFINENNIKESDSIDVETFIEFETNTGNIVDGETSKENENKELEVNKPKDVIILNNNQEKNLINITPEQDNYNEIIIEKTEAQKLEEEIEAQKLEEEFKKLIDILFEVSN